jgi:hypothetical protein
MVAPFLRRVQRLVPSHIKAQFNLVRAALPGSAAPQSSAEAWQKMQGNASGCHRHQNALKKSLGGSRRQNFLPRGG